MVCSKFFEVFYVKNNFRRRLLKFSLYCQNLEMSMAKICFLIVRYLAYMIHNGSFCFLTRDGGRFANGIITRTYKQGQVIDADIYLTTSHRGYFEFRIGEFDNTKTSGNSIGKLNGHLMELVSLTNQICKIWLNMSSPILTQLYKKIFTFWKTGLCFDILNVRITNLYHKTVG